MILNALKRQNAIHLWSSNEKSEYIIRTGLEKASETANAIIKNYVNAP